MNIKASCGMSHTVLLSATGKVFTFGYNANGQLGLGHTKNINIPTMVENIPCIEKIACGFNYTLCLDYDGDVWGFGKNLDLQLGINNKNNITTPTKITKLSNIIHIAAGNNFSAVIDKDNNVFCFGLCEEIPTDGIFIPGDTYSSFPYKINLTNIVDIACGNNYMICKDKNGIIWGCGTNYSNQIRLETSIVKKPVQIEKIPKIVKIAVGYWHTLLLDESGIVWKFGSNSQKQLSPNPTSNKFDHPYPIIDISCGYFQTALVDSQNTLYIFGNNNFYQVGEEGPLNVLFKDPSSLNKNNIKILSMGGHHGIGYNIENNELWVFGRNYAGQLGINKVSEKELPTKIPDDYCFNIFQTNRQKSARK